MFCASKHLELFSTHQMPPAHGADLQNLWIQTHMSVAESVAQMMGLDVDTTEEDKTTTQSTSMGGSTAANLQAHLRRLAENEIRMSPRDQAQQIMEQHQVYAKMQHLVQKDRSIATVAAAAILCATPEMRMSTATASADESRGEGSEEEEEEEEDEENEPWLNGVSFSEARKRTNKINMPMVEAEFRKRWDALMSDFGRCMQANKVAAPEEKLTKEQMSGVRDAALSIGESLRKCRVALLGTLTLPMGSQAGSTDMLRLDSSTSTAKNLHDIERLIKNGDDISRIIEQRGTDEEGNIMVIQQEEDEEMGEGGGPGGGGGKRSKDAAMMVKVNKALDYINGIMRATGCKIMDGMVWVPKAGHPSVYEPGKALKEYVYAQVPRDLNPDMWANVLSCEKIILRALEQTQGCAPMIVRDDNWVAFRNGILDRQNCQLRTDCVIPCTVFVDQECPEEATAQAARLIEEGICSSDPRLQEWQRAMEEHTPAFSQLGRTQDFECSEGTKQEHARQAAAAKALIRAAKKCVRNKNDPEGAGKNLFEAMQLWQWEEAYAAAVQQGFSTAVGEELESITSLKNVEKDTDGVDPKLLRQQRAYRDQRIGVLKRNSERDIAYIGTAPNPKRVPEALRAVLVEFESEEAKYVPRRFVRESKRDGRDRIFLFADGHMDALHAAYKVVQTRARAAYEMVGDTAEVFKQLHPKLAHHQLAPRFCRWCAYYMHGCSQQHMTSLSVAYGGIMQTRDVDGVRYRSWIPGFEPWCTHFETDCDATRSGRDLMLYAIGHAQYPANKYIDTGRVTVLPGASGAGKSTILNTVTQGFRNNGVMTFTPLGDGRFLMERGAEIVNGNPIQFAQFPDMSPDTVMPQGTFLSMAVCDRMNTPVRNKASVEFQWTAAVWMLMNQPPHFMQDSMGNMLRRILPITFLRAPSIVDSTLSKRVMEEYSVLVVAGILMFRAMCNRASKTNPVTGRAFGLEGVAPVCFFRNLVRFSAQLHPLVAFFEENKHMLVFGHMEKGEWARFQNSEVEDEMGAGAGGGGMEEDDEEEEAPVRTYRGPDILHHNIYAVQSAFLAESNEAVEEEERNKNKRYVAVHCDFEEFKRVVTAWGKRNLTKEVRARLVWVDRLYQDVFTKNGLKLAYRDGVRVLKGVALTPQLRRAFTPHGEEGV